MTTYYLKTILVTTAGVVADEPKYVYTDETACLVTFHSNMASYMNASDVAMATLMMVVDDGKNVYVARQETFRRATEETAEE